jgi:hypothetical protein
MSLSMLLSDSDLESGHQQIGQWLVHPAGVLEISRRLSEATPPEDLEDGWHPAGVPESFLQRPVVSLRSTTG